MGTEDPDPMGKEGRGDHLARPGCEGLPIEGETDLLPIRGGEDGMGKNAVVSHDAHPR